ncbi:M14 family zinc carboxypeptidase [Bacterioplanoides sp.]|uniref:M14 family zinc carboxypeptidase n=1 Tax=Bacterioplanoides sp. TaxID=2066072 RepID=UPI003B00EA85
MIQRIYHIKRALPELFELEELIEQGREHLRVSVPAHIQHTYKHQQTVPLPFYVLEAGSDAPLAPTLVLVGGVHGIERIGTQVILSFLRTLLQRLAWEPVIHEQLAQIRLVMIPIVNPGGMWQNSRSNPNGVDLMRNAPVDAEDNTFLVGGQRLSKHLPWYRGRKDSQMEAENQALTQAIRQVLSHQKHAISLDCHSGFGAKDRIWFPYAKSKSPWPNLAEAFALTELFETTYPYHDVYLFEPQSQSYTTHGDIWDYLYDDYLATQPDGLYLPLTLEMGSWLWVRKNPRHLLRYHSLFNPILPHRHHRILRRHLTLFDFLLSAVRSMPAWAPTGVNEKSQLHHQALKRWYPGSAFSAKPGLRPE